MGTVTFIRMGERSWCGGELLVDPKPLTTASTLKGQAGSMKNNLFRTLGFFKFNTYGLIKFVNSTCSSSSRMEKSQLRTPFLFSYFG